MCTADLLKIFFISKRCAMEFTEEPSKTTELVTAADGDDNWRKLSSNGENLHS